MKMRNDGREMKSIKSIFAIVAAVVIGLAAGAINQTAAQKKAAPRVKGNAWAAQQTGSTPEATAAFAAARDLIDDAQWSKAEQAFGQYLTRFPREENLDAAMYWTAYAQYQMKKYTVCKTTIEKMLQAYAKTSWKQDADLLMAQLPGAAPVAIAGTPMTADVAVLSSAPMAAAVEAATMAPVNTTVVQSPGQAVTISPEMQERVAEAKMRADERLRDAQERTAERVKEMQDKMKDKTMFHIGEGMGIGMGKGIGSAIAGERLADDDPCEFKIIVLRALFESDPQRGIAASTDWLKPNSGQTPPCRRAALTLLARNGGKTAIPTIMSSAQSDPDLRVRSTAISLLGATNDDSVIDALRDFLLNAPQPEINEAALYALSQHNSPRALTIMADFALSNKPLTLRKAAIARISERAGEPAVDALFKIYDGSSELDVKKTVISGLSRRRSERAGEKVLQIARTAPDVELRKAAISGLGRRGGTTYIDALMSLYDSEQNQEIKDQILNSLAYSSDQKVIDKLISIAKNPQTPIERKRRIVMLLANKNKNPAVIAFFEELLKQ
jgi:hypothetical protein